MAKTRDTKTHIGIFGRRNVGKSSFINTLTGQDIAIVSHQAGTTTDPVKKSIEIKGVGPVVIIDTAGIDDVGELGKKRIEKSFEVIRTIDLGILLISQNKFGEFEKDLIHKFKKYDIPWVCIHNKSDVESLKDDLRKEIELFKVSCVDFSTKKPTNLDKIIGLIKDITPETSYKNKSILGDIIGKGDMVMLITPIDIAAPEGRLILPQVQMIRDIIDNRAIAIVLQEDEVEDFLNKSNIKPKLVICDSQIFDKADAIVPKEIPLTSFSVVLARQKGDFESYMKGTPHLSKLKDGDKVLLLESCTHLVSCEDIGRVKLPNWINNFTKKTLQYDFVAGLDKIDDISKYAIVIQCGGCMVTKKQLQNRLKAATDIDIPVTNYGLAIAYMHGIYHRAIEIFQK